MRRPGLPRPGTKAAIATTVVAAVAAAGTGGYLIGDGAEQEPVAGGPAPEIVIQDSAPGDEGPAAADAIGFPAFATRNTTRVAGADPVAVAAGIALASYPSVGDVPAAGAAVLAPADDWRAALAASVLAAEPIAAPILLAGADELPPLTASALSALALEGLDRADGAPLITIGTVAAPDGIDALGVEGADYTELARAIDRTRALLSGQQDPEHILVVPSREPAMAMPAAAWAARSGDPIVFSSRDSVPAATLDVLERHPKAAVYVLGPSSAISSKAVDELEKAADRVERISEATDPVELAVDFATYSDGAFGWNIFDPGHGFALASVSRPADAAAAAPLAAGGKPGPLLLTDNASEVPEALEGFLLDVKPGFETAPERAVYNHIWVLGDSAAISVGLQAQIDELAKLVPVPGAAAGSGLGGEPESQPPIE